MTHTGFSFVAAHWSMPPLLCIGLYPLPMSGGFFFLFTFQSVLTQVGSWKPTNLFAFNAPAFHPIYATTFLLNFFQHIIIEGWTFDSIVGLLLNTSALSCHTGIIHFWTCDSVVKSCILKWTHSRTQPWGNLVPYQCLSCHCIQAWDQKSQGTLLKLGRDITKQCSYEGVDGQCSRHLKFNKPSVSYKSIKLSEGAWVAFGPEKSDFL